MTVETVPIVSGVADLTSLEHSYKDSCRVATTANITLSGTQTIDGIAVVAGDRVLVKNQATGSQNGIYIVATGAWTRSTDANTADSLEGANVFIEEGTANADTSWVQIVDNFTLGTDTVTFSAMQAGAPTGAQYLVLAADATLTAERVITIATANGLRATDAGAGGAYTIFNTLIEGLAGGQTIIGGTAASNNLTLRATSNAIDGSIIFETDPTTEAGRFPSAGGFLVGTTSQGGGGFVTIRKDQNAETALRIDNNSGGASAKATIVVTTGAGLNTQFTFSVNAATLQAEFLSSSGTTGGIVIATAAAAPIILQTQSAEVARFFSGGDFTHGASGSGVFHLIRQPVKTSGSPVGFQFEGGAHTTLTASAEALDVQLFLSRTVQFNTGALTTQRAVLISAPTYAFVGASTITDAATLAIGGAPVAGTNATITNAYSLWVQGGLTRLGGQLHATAGTAAAPGMAFSGDPDTGIRNSAVNEINLVTGGTDRMRLSGSGFFPAVLFAPLSDNNLDCGGPSNRWNEIFVASAGGLRVLAASGDTNPTVRVSSTIDFGPGGAVATNVSLTWGATDRLDLASGDSFNIVLGHLLVGGATFETGSTNTVAILNGTAPDAGVADEVILYSSDDAAGHTIPSFFCEGTNVLATGQADSASSVRVKARINGTVVTLLAI